MSSSSPRLTVLGGSLAGKELTIEDAVDNVLIGSDPSCRFCLQLPGVSPIHARLWIDPQGITVYDTNAPQGLFVNDDRVTSQAALRNGDILWLGTPGQDDVVMIQCRIVSRTASAAAAPPEPAHDASDATAVLAPPAGALSSGFEPLEAAEPEMVEPSPPAAQPQPESVDQTVVLHDVTMDETALMSPPPPPPEPEPEPEPPVLEQPEPPPVVAPPPLPVVAPVFEEDIEESVTVRTEAQPTVHLPPPPVVAPRPVAPPPAPSHPPAHAARPVTAAPRPAAAPVPHPVKRAPERKAGGGGGGKLVGVAAALLLVIGGGGAAAWYFLLGPGAAKPAPSVAPSVTLAQAPTPEPAATLPAPSAAEPTPEPPVEETVTIVQPPSAAPSPLPTPSGKPTPSATPSKPGPAASGKPTPAPAQATPDPAQLRTQQVATLVAQADTAMGEKRYDAAASLYDQALQLDSQNAQAAKGKASAQAASSASRRSLVAGRSTLTGAKTDKKLTGFESEDVSLAKAPDYSGRLDFEASPKSPRAGDSYSVRVYLTNDGKKPFKIASFSATTNASGEKSGGPMAPATKEVQPQQKALLQELSGVWREGATSWALDVSVQSAHGEAIRNTLTWR